MLDAKYEHISIKASLRNRLVAWDNRMARSTSFFGGHIKNTVIIKISYKIRITCNIEKIMLFGTFV